MGKLIFLKKVLTLINLCTIIISATKKSIGGIWLCHHIWLRKAKLNANGM